MLRKLLVLVLAAVAAVAVACMWDYDTFAVEAAGKNDVVAVLAGRFERNPPLYYEMRLKHGLEEIEKFPKALDLYDNAAVAAERLGDSAQAMRIIARKRAQMRPLPEDKDAWYRYYANLGTFRAHGAMKKKGKVRRAELTQAEKEIARAIEINPNAHFGREKYQLGVIRWLLDDKGEYPMSLGQYLEEKALLDSDKPEAAIKGLSGLIRLGTAWENMDVWGALAVALEHKQDASLAHFAIDRIRELEKAGKKSAKPALLGPSYEQGPGRSFAAYVEEEVAWAPTDEIVEQNKTVYADLRKEADRWDQARTAYMLERLKAGKHPDWDKDFWSEWKDEPKLTVPKPGLIERVPQTTKVWVAVVFWLAVPLALLIVAFVVGRRVLVRTLKKIRARGR